MCNAMLPLLAVLALNGLAAAGEWKVPLTVHDYDGVNRGATDVCNGVPLLPGQAGEVAELRLLDEGGKEVVAQFRPLARWRTRDNSLRWVLVDFQTPLPEGASRTFYLANGGKGPADSPLKVSQTDDRITVDTGVAKFEINRKRFNLFDRVRLDVNSDGTYGDDEEAVSPSEENGAIVEDTFGVRYTAAEGTEEVKIEESGPVRVCVLARGRHLAAKGAGYSLGMYRFAIRMHFYANSALVRLDPVIENNETTPIGSPTFEDYSLVTQVNIVPAVNTNPDYVHGKVALFRFHALAPMDGELRENEKVTIYQDSNGSETWKVNPGVEGRGTGKLSTFRGYKIVKQTAGGPEELAHGDLARGVAHLSGEKFGLIVAPRYFWQQFPKAITLGHDGSVRLGVFPREYSAAHWLADGGGAGMETVLYFYARNRPKPPAGVKPRGIEFSRDNSTKSPWWNLFRDRPWAHVVADTAEPLFALATPEHYGACGALADVGPYVAIHPERESDFPFDVTMRRYFTTDYLKGDAFGWQVWGCRWEEHAGHSPWNYEAIATNDFAWRFINTGFKGWRDIAYPRLRHFSTVRCFRVGDAPVWGGSIGRTFIVEDHGRPARADAEAAKYSEGRYPRAEWPLPNQEHSSLDALYALYLFYGDQRAYEGLKYPAAVAAAAITRPFGAPDRVRGWSLRCLLSYIDLTGDKDAKGELAKALDNFWTFGRTQKGLSGKWPYNNNWLYGIFTRSVVMACTVTGDERMRDLAIGMARAYPPENPAGDYTQKRNDPLVTAFAYSQTGRAEFANPRAAEQFSILGDNQFQYMVACAAWLWTQPRPDKTPPAAVRDLTAEPAAAGEVKLAWTAPGGDGDQGAAAVYQVKYDDAPLVEVAGAGTVNFWAANNVAGEPTPARAGAHESFTVRGLSAGTYYFAVKSRDRANNESEISNVAKVQVR